MNIIFSSFRAGKDLVYISSGCARGYSYLALSEPAVIKNEEHVTLSQNDLVNSVYKKKCIKGSPLKGGEMYYT